MIVATVLGLKPLRLPDGKVTKYKLDTPKPKTANTTAEKTAAEAFKRYENAFKQLGGRGTVVQIHMASGVEPSKWLNNHEGVFVKKDGLVKANRKPRQIWAWISD